ncbi:hypothetical protein MKW98_028862 [Papaver atlanticum]|uniref:CBM20 domain-containing protein n=1 Tax=Papaver atlanticum TaxID=357466 RepID=A0AAD4S396_9MAGN|nr:hypothetical protein MKW98_028862 [Papaver atlanticum]
METLLSFNSSSHPLLLQSSKNKAFYPFRPSSSSSLLPSTKKHEFVSFYQKRDYSNVDVSHSISLQLKTAIGSVSCKSSASDQSSFHPQSKNNAGNTKIPSQETQFLVVGDDPILGVWNPLSGIPLKWSQGHIWTAEIDVPVNKTIQFMFLLKDQTGEFVWQPGPRRVFQTGETSKMIVLESWDFEEEPLANPNTLEDVTAQSKTVKVKFQLPSRCLVGQEFFLIGDDPILGGWDPSGAIPLKWSKRNNGDLWTSAALDLPIGKTVQFRFMLKDQTTGEVILWQPRPSTFFRPWEIDADQTFMVCGDFVNVIKTKDSEEESTEEPEFPTRPNLFKDAKYDPTKDFGKF